MAYYIGILDGSARTWGVRIPDFPGVHGGGATPDEAIADVISALREVGAIMVAEGTPLPPARSLAEISADADAAPNARDGEVAVMIPVLVDEGRTVKANVSLDKRLLETIDTEAKARGLTRSAFLASAAIEKIQKAG